MRAMASVYPKGNFDCEICGKRVASLKRSCSGDGGRHHHGMVHTSLRGNRNDLANVGNECGCASKDEVGWKTGATFADLPNKEV